ncbi:stathmin domain-containing protein 1 [Cynoglossus semilaevis]|uniref:Stathmin domain containing 1 n=1 Tax=Cynoglossus semilaevis TaxID=244447 RepID=A0A3P8WTU9_CYNSE|nr:stathmin domain-containing protein 1 [Cynoglossus semilaevis]
MGCCSSTNTAVQTLSRGGADGEEDETGSKLGNRGDSAVSKETSDSGVGMDNKEMPTLPGVVPRKLPPLSSGCGGESVAGAINQEGFLQHDSTVPERQKSSEILEELLNQGIIPEGQTKEKSKMTGEAYSIMLDDSDVVRRRPPARLESLKAMKMQSVHSKEEIEEKMRLADERRKSKEDELKTRLRTKSARVRVPVPVSSTTEDGDTSLTPVEPLHLPHTSDSPQQIDSQGTFNVAEGEGSVGEARPNNRESGGEMKGAEMEKRREKEEQGVEGRKEGAERMSEDGDEQQEELTQVTEFLEEQLLTTSGVLESDSSFQRVDDKSETF